MNTKEILVKIFKDPKTKYQLTEFEMLGKPIHEIIDIYSKTITSGKETGKVKYYLKSLVIFPSGKDEVQVYSEDGKSSPEEIVRQLWVYKLINYYGYEKDELTLEDSVTFGSAVGTKAADIVVYHTDKITPKIGRDVSESVDFSGKEIKRPTFIGSDEVILKTLISSVYEKSDIFEEEFYSNKSVIKNHIDYGCNILKDLFQESGQDANKFLLKIVDLIELEGAREFKGKGLDVFIGRKLLNNEEIILELNNTAKHANSHLAIMGKPGVGKTQFLLKILADICIQSKYQTNFIFFDYKGDVVDNDAFIEVTRARTFRLLKNNESLPINPFVLPNYDDQSILVSAREKAESFASINSKLGVVQKGALTEAIRAAYAKRSITDIPYPDFRDVLDIVQKMYEEEGKKDDSLIEVLRDLSNFNLFWNHGSSLKPIDRLSNRTMIIDVHEMPVLKELVGYLIIERLYKEMASLPDSPIKDGRRTIRTILVIDEAHNYLPQKNIFLQRIIREGRSKGIVVFFASQSPTDYQQKFFNFQELLEFVFIFQSEGVSAPAIQDILGCNAKTAKDLQSEISRLEPFQVITKGWNKTDEFVKFMVEAFYKNY